MTGMLWSVVFGLIAIIAGIIAIIIIIYLGWMIGYEYGWHDRCVNHKHRLRKEAEMK